VGLLLTALVAFLSLVWLGLMLINIAGLLKSPERYDARGRKGRVLVMVPCKGMDITLRSNLESLKDQDYPNYKVVAIVDNNSDRAVTAIKKAGLDYIISSKRYKDCSGKVRAIITAMQKFRNYDIYVNIDSDAHCERNHISELVAPLNDKSVGVSSAYAYFNPVGGFWSVVKMAWGFVGNGMMESKLTRFVWGGSMAFRKGLMGPKEFKVFERAVVDDITIGYFARSRGLRIAYASRRTARVNTADSFSQFYEWSTRQTALTLLGNRKVLYYGMAFYVAQALLLVSGIALSFLSPWYLILLLPFAMGVYKTYKRSEHHYLSVFPICFIINFIFIANLLSAARMKEIEWRGSRYRLSSPF
jgi:hypothetical protein